MGCNTSQEKPASAISTGTADEANAADITSTEDNKNNVETELLKSKISLAPVAAMEDVSDSLPMLNGEPLGKDEGRIFFTFVFSVNGFRNAINPHIDCINMKSV